MVRGVSARAIDLGELARMVAALSTWSASTGTTGMEAATAEI
ncbi:MAG: hypothetical protein ACJ8DI_28685 [Ktedonobacteraceae bacterium]